MRKLLILLALTATAAVAAPATAEPQSYRLSQAEIDATVAEASHRPETPALLPPQQGLFLPNLPAGGSMPSVRDKSPHGVAGFSVSSDGGYSLFSATSVPIGEDSFASFAFSYSRQPGYYYLPYGSTLPYAARPRY